MANMDIEQVVMTLKQKFDKAHQFIFWYDDEGEFADSLSDLKQSLTGCATVVELEKGHQLQTKLHLLKAPRDEKFLIYAPYPQPHLEENHLRDMILYSDTFKADSQEIIRRELKLPENMRSFLLTYRSFFANKRRRERFKKYDFKSYQQQPVLGIMAAITRLEQPLVDFFSILRIIIKAGLTDNKYLLEFKKYNILEDFWQIVQEQFYFSKAKDSLQLLDLCAALYVTVTFKQMDLIMPDSAKNLDLSSKLANVQTFMQQFNTDSYGDKEDSFAKTATLIWKHIDHDKLFGQIKIDDIAKATTFEAFDKRLLSWLQEQLPLDNTELKVNGLDVYQLTKMRRETHYGRTVYFSHLYQMMRSAWRLKAMVKTQPADNLNDIINDYQAEGYLVDMDYRHFIYDFKKASMPETFLKSKHLIEAWYTEYLNQYGTAWNTHFTYDDIDAKDLQKNFYKQYVGAETNRIVVIISDALRFEVAKELEGRFAQDAQITEHKMHHMITCLPSVTYVGMPALLPHEKLRLQENAKSILVDDMSANTVKERAAILQTIKPKSVAYNFRELQSKTTAELKKLFVNQDVVYIYHNQIDTTAENRGTEDETFVAAAEAVEDLTHFVGRLRAINIKHLYITADHGYIYRDEKPKDIDTIEMSAMDMDHKSARYLITNRDINLPGVRRQPLAKILNNTDTRFVYYPMTANVFRASGGYNYVHGGSSLQEMLVPMLELKTSSNRSEATLATLEVVSVNRRLTSLEVPLTILQPEPISALVRPTSYKLYFVDYRGQEISGQILINANKKFEVVGDRIQTIQITLIDQAYDRSKDYYLIIEDIKNHTKQKIKYVMDIVNLNDL